MKPYKIASNHDDLFGSDICPLETDLRDFNYKEAIQKLSDDNNFLSWLVWCPDLTYIL